MRWFLGVFILLSAQKIQKEIPFNFVVWDVGQGAWSTYVDEQQCLHFDMGGEHFPWHQILSLCQNKENQIYLTHEDWDHVNGVFFFSKKVRKLCLYFPRHLQRSGLQKVSKCVDRHKRVDILSHGTENSDRNSSSVIYLLRGQVLITGDAPRQQEKLWAYRVPRNLKVLLLGHHGSQTSTSKKLLARIQPKVAIASARQAKYGHPHPKIKSRLTKKKVPMLRTETFGSIFIKID